MNSFIENVNYVAGLDNLYGSRIELYKNNLSLKSVQHDIELKFSYYNNDDKKIHSIVHSEPGVLVGGINDTLLSFKTLVESSITGSEFTCTVSSGVQNFVINNIVMVNISIVSNSDTYKTYELEMKVVTAGDVTYNVFGEVKDSLNILPSLATITASDIDAMVNVYEIQEEVITVASNIVGLNSIVSNMTEILLADDNAAIATTKALESSDSAAASLQSSLDSAASAALFPNHISDTTNPHEVTKAQVGLEFVENTADIDKIVASAGKLTSARNISLSGDAAGNAYFDGSGDADIVVSIDNDSHTHQFGLLTDIPTTLNGYGITDAATSDHNHSDVTTSVSGFMSTSDKIKLDTIAPSSNNYVHPSTHDASMITTTDEFSNSDSTNVQDVLDDLDYAIDVEKGRIDAILIGSGANADTFAEVVTLVNSIDTTNDQAFAGYVLSNDARSATIEGNVTNLTSSKADKATTYTKSETDAKIIELSPATDISGKADKATTLDGYGITDAYTKTKINSSLALKVDKVAGKELSTEDYSTAEKSKLAGIAASANNYSLPVASASVLGGVKAGANVSIDANGVISASASGGADARIEKFIENPDSTSGIVTVPKTIATGETITIPAGRVAILPNVQIDGVLNVEGEVFIPSGATLGDLDAQLALKAPLVNPSFTNPTATTQSAQDNSTKVATTAYVDGKMVLGTAVNSTSGTSIDFTDIPSWAKKITVMFNGVSTNGTSGLMVQLGDSGGIETSGYVGAVWSGAGAGQDSIGFVIQNNMIALQTQQGSVRINLFGGSIYVEDGNVGPNLLANAIAVSCGSKSLSSTLDRVRITTLNGTDTFDAGQINIMYEG